MATPPSGVFHHAGFVVHDVEQAAGALAESLSIGPWNIWTIEPTECTLYGKSTSFSFRVALAQAGGASYELLSPASGESVYNEHLTMYGEGFHHTCLMYPDLETLRAARTELVGQGRELLQAAVVGDIGEFCYFRIPEIGSVIELLYLGELPPPEKTIG
jgi:hypothetical protein